MTSNVVERQKKKTWKEINNPQKEYLKIIIC